MTLTEIEIRAVSARLTRLSDIRNTMSKYTAFRCPEDLLELAKVKAKNDRRSLSNYIITLIEKDVKDMAPAEEQGRVGSARRRA